MSALWTRPAGSTARRLAARLALVVVPTLAISLPLVAQRVAWTSGCRLPLATADSADATEFLAIAIAPDDRGDRRRTRRPGVRRALGIALQEIATRLAPPSVLPLAFDAQTPYATLPRSEGGSLLVPRLASRLAFTLDRDGRITDIELARHEGVPLLDSLVVAALRAADSSGTLVMVDVDGSLFERRDVVRLSLLMSWATDTTMVRTPVARVRLPIFTGIGARHAEGNRFPDYPAELAARGEEGDVLLEYDVDAAGNVDRLSVEIDGDAPRDLRDATLQAVRQWHFAPAQVHGCPVRAHVRQTFRYRAEP